MSTLNDEQVTRMTSKGQVLIHKSVREMLGLQPGAHVRVGRNDRGEAVIAPVEFRPADPAERRRRMREGLLEMSGKFHDGRSTNDKMREMRGDPQP